MTTETPEYVPIGFDQPCEKPAGSSCTMMVSPLPGQLLRACGLRFYNRPGEVEVFRLSYFDDFASLDAGRPMLSASGPFDAADYNVELGDAVESVHEPDAPRFCRVHWGLVSLERPVTITFASKSDPEARFRGTLFCRRVLPNDPIGAPLAWHDDRHFMRFLQCSFEKQPPGPACELIYYGWIGRRRAGE